MAKVTFDRDVQLVGFGQVLDIAANTETHVPDEFVHIVRAQGGQVEGDEEAGEAAPAE